MFQLFSNIEDATRLQSLKNTIEIQIYNLLLPIFKIEGTMRHFLFPRKNVYPMMKGLFKMLRNFFSFQNWRSYAVIFVGY